MSDFLIDLFDMSKPSVLATIISLKCIKYLTIWMILKINQSLLIFNSYSGRIILIRSPQRDN